MGEGFVGGKGTVGSEIGGVGVANEGSSIRPVGINGISRRALVWISEIGVVGEVIVDVIVCTSFEHASLFGAFSFLLFWGFGSFPIGALLIYSSLAQFSNTVSL